MPALLEDRRLSMVQPNHLLPLLLLAVGCRDEAPADPVLPHDTFRIESKVLGESRTINVYTPPGADDARLPVLYMPDGGIGEDFPHITNTIDALIREGAIAPLRVVGVENTERRRDLTGPTVVATDREVAPVVGGSAAFRKFVVTELIPGIQSRYPCDDRRALVGESLAGLFVVETMFEAPDVFDVYLAMSPSLWWNDHALLRHATERLPQLAGRPRRLWLTAADEEDIRPFTDELAGVLRSHAPPSLTWSYAPRDDAKHWTIFRATTPTAFREALWSR